MSVHTNRLTAAELKAPAGQFRLVMGRTPASDANVVEHYLIGDLLDQHEAVRAWQKLNNPITRQRGVTFTVFDDKGRVVDALGTHITEEERVAPPGRFRLIAADFNIRPAIIWLVHDFDDSDEAIEAARESHEGPYTGFQVHDDTGAALIPVD